MNSLVEDFLQYLRHERGQSDNTAENLRRAARQIHRLGGEAKSHGLEVRSS